MLALKGLASLKHPIRAMPIALFVLVVVGTLSSSSNCFCFPPTISPIGLLAVEQTPSTSRFNSHLSTSKKAGCMCGAEASPATWCCQIRW